MRRNEQSGEIDGTAGEGHSSPPRRACSREAAKTSGIPVQTLRRWLQEDAFRDAYGLARRQAVEGAIAGLQGLTATAVETLKAALGDTNKNVAVKAARTVLDYAVKGFQLFDLTKQLDELEALLGMRVRGETKP